MPIQEVVTGLKSTTKPETSQYSAIYELLNRHLTMKIRLFMNPWPVKDRDGE